MSVIWTLTLALVTSLLTTVAVEYFARPSLEARKARMLRAQDAFLTVTTSLDRLVMLASHMPSEEEVTSRPSLATFRKLRIPELVKATDDTTDAMARLPIGYVVKHGEHIGRTAQTLGYIRAALLDMEQDNWAGDVALQKAFAGFEFVRDYFEIYPTIRDSRQSMLARWLWRRTQQRRYAKDSMRFVEGLGNKRVTE